LWDKSVGHQICNEKSVKQRQYRDKSVKHDYQGGPKVCESEVKGEKCEATIV